ncbi:UNVERIFIED_CONTAM: hypothetical protein Slati_3094300 [Sesamum latifolium]|uniref:G-patch domain-containing protein n=1 Tax=Sesamum latifolium TaxID=2727402 RepID=A0AAW2UU07_9LAMI
MQLAQQDKISLEEDSAATKLASAKCGSLEDLLLGSKPHNRPLFVAGDLVKEDKRAIGVIRIELLIDDMVSTALFHVTDAKTSYNMLLGRPWLHENSVVPSTWHQCFKYCHKEKEVLLPEEPKSYNSQSARKNDSSAIEVELLKSLTLPLTQNNMKQPSKPPLKGVVLSTQEEGGGYETLVIDEKGFDPKAFKLLIKAGYNPKEKLSLGKLPPEATGKKFHGLNATQVMLKEKGHAVQDSRVGLGFTPPKPVRIAIKRPGLYKKVVYPKKGMFKVAARTKKNIKSSHTQKLKSLIPSRMRRRTILAISCGKVLKVKAQTMIFTQALYDEDDSESVASSNYISSNDSSHDEQYIVKEAYTNGTCRMSAEDGLKFGLINEKFLKREVYTHLMLSLEKDRSPGQAADLMMGVLPSGDKRLMSSLSFEDLDHMLTLVLAKVYLSTRHLCLEGRAYRVRQEDRVGLNERLLQRNWRTAWSGCWGKWTLKESKKEAVARCIRSSLKPRRGRTSWRLAGLAVWLMHQKSDAYQKEVALIWPFSALPSSPTSMETPPLESEEDLDCLLGEAEAEVRDASSQVESGAAEEKIPKEELPQLIIEDAAGPSKESQGKEENAEVDEKISSVGDLSLMYLVM